MSKQFPMEFNLWEGDLSPQVRWNLCQSGRDRSARPVFFYLNIDKIIF